MFGVNFVFPPLFCGDDFSYMMMTMIMTLQFALQNKLGRGHRDKVQQFMTITGARYFPSYLFS